MNEKLCKKCNTSKDISEFYKNKNKKDGYHYMCKSCSKIELQIYRSKNKDKAKKYRELNKNKFKEYYKLKSKQNWVLNREKVLISNYTKKDNNRNLVCDLTIEWMKENISNKSCIYCGDTENLGCDRIDNTKGHTKDNVVPCCASCNKTRGDRFSFEEMILIGKTIIYINNLRTKNNE